ncbi:MAG: DUF2934 domain-containing protein [Halothiobacillus sp.]
MIDQNTTETTTPISAEIRHRMIAEAAYFRAEKRGFTGTEMAQDWSEAEAEIDRKLQSITANVPEKITFEDKLRQQISVWDSRLNHLAEDAKSAKATVKANIEKHIVEMTAHRQTLKEKLNELQASSTSRWDELKHQTEQMLTSMQDAYDRAAIQKEAFQDKLTARLAVWDAQYHDLKDKAKTASAETQAALEVKMHELGERRAAAATQLAQLRSKSAEAWEDMKTGVDKTWKQMRETLDRVARHFK